MWLYVCWAGGTSVGVGIYERPLGDGLSSDCGTQRQQGRDGPRWPKHLSGQMSHVRHNSYTWPETSFLSRFSRLSFHLFIYFVCFPPAHLQSNVFVSVRTGSVICIQQGVKHKCRGTIVSEKPPSSNINSFLRRLANKVAWKQLCARYNILPTKCR